ncbi:MAG: hypothetical protein KDD26_00755 [Winogradskyella sp.]|nr:hypothetical protein [Winogradskyella sp.]
MKLKLLFILLSLSFSVNAQYEEWGNGKIYLKDGTVKEGLVRFYYAGKGTFGEGGNEKMRYKTERNKPSQKISAKDVDSIRFDVINSKKARGKITKKKRSALFVSIAKNEKKTKFGFAELVEKGKVNVLKRSLTDSHEPKMKAIIETLFMREGEPAVGFSLIELKSFKNRAIEYFEDCPSLVVKLEKKQFGRSDLLKIAEYYNSNCL